MGSYLFGYCCVCRSVHCHWAHGKYFDPDLDAETNLGQFFIAYMAGARFDLIWKDMGKIGAEKPDFLKSADELMEPPVHGEL